MAAPAQPFILSKKSHDALILYFIEAYNFLDKQWAIRSSMERLDRAYIREVDWTAAQVKAKEANELSFNPTKFQNIIVPVAMPQVESAVAYQTQVFLTGNPMFGVVAPPAFQDSALAMETKIEADQNYFGWLRHFIKFFRDGFKYNLSAICVDWEEDATAAIDTDVSLSAGRNSSAVKNVTYAGNKIERWDMYNTFWDTRYEVPDIPKRGEFAGTTRLMSRIELKMLIKSLTKVQTRYLGEAFESGIADTYYIPSLNPDTIVDDTIYARSTNWLAWMGLQGEQRKVNYKDFYEVSWLYARIIPSDFAIGGPQQNTPQVWKFIIVNQKVCIYAERMTNAHAYLPVIFGCPLEFGLGYQDKSLVGNVMPMQAVSSALANANIASRRRAISDRLIYDPSRVSEIHINSDSPTAKIPLRPAAFGRNPNESVMLLPYRDDQNSTNWQDMQLINSFSDRIAGQNPARQGQFVKGNKTKVEYQDVQGNATARDQMTAITMESQVMTPVKTIIKTNILQYQGQQTLFNQSQQKVVEVDPVKLRQAIMTFRMSDGLIPSDKLISGDDWGIAMQVMGSSPQIGSAYNIAPMFSYMMKVRGADLRPFEKSQEQQAYEQALGTWQQTVMELTQVALKQGQMPDPKMFPPQPKPADYGYNPNPGAPAQNNGTQN